MLSCGARQAQTMESAARAQIARSRRPVIKIGSAVLAGADGRAGAPRLDRERFKALCSDIAATCAQGKRAPIVVTSGAVALTTGESLGQVASQTLSNITRIDEAATMPILRPLIGMDKLEITDEARRLGTFEISIEPDADCCTLFVPKHPATRMSEHEVSAVESRLEIPRLVASGCDGASVEAFEFPA